MTQPNIKELVQTDVNAIAALLNESLQPQGITAKVVLKDVYLQIMLESAQVPAQNLVVPLISNQLITLNIQSCKKVKIYGRQIGEDFPDWQHEFELQKSQAEQPSIWGSLFGAVAHAAGAVGGAAVGVGGAVVGTAVGVGGAIATSAVQAPEGLGHLLGLVGDSPQLQQLTKTLQVDWLFKIIDQVDMSWKILREAKPHRNFSAC